MNLFWGLVAVCFAFCEGRVRNTTNYNRFIHASVVDVSEEVGDGTGNATVYLGYANNPFGPSTRLKNKITFDVETGELEQRSKRGIFTLFNMVRCSTGCNPLTYKGYGCFCGFLGSGYPVDGIDRCCKLHDWCYDSANCPMYLEYFVPYYWKCFRSRPYCALGHGGICAQRLCECDRALAECLTNYPCPSTRPFCRSSPWRLLQNALLIL